MDHPEWIKNQFKKVRGRAWYRDVIIHASFIETATKSVAKERNSFDCAIKILKASEKYKDDKLDEIERLRKLRNRMIHDLLKDKELTNEAIIKTIREMKKILKDIYHNSVLIQEYFQKHRGINTKDFN
mgnify:CR=1 FL=1